MSFGNWFHWYRTTASLNARSWFICVAVLLVTLMRSGLHYSYGEFLVDLRDDFNGSSMTEGNWIGTLVMTTSMTFAPISVSFIRLFDTRGYQWCIFGGLIICSLSCILSSLMTSFHALVFTYSILQGIGTSITYMASSLILIDYFDKAHPYHVLGTSILYCGYPLGSVIFNPIYATLVDDYGWRISLRIASAILFITAFATAPIFVSKYNDAEYDIIKQRESKGSLLIPLDKLRRAEVILWFTVNLTTFLGFYMPIVNLPTYMRDKGYQGPVISLAVTVLSFSEIIAYIGASLIGDLLKGRLIVVNLISSMALCAIYFVWPSVDEAGWFMIIAMSIGSGFFLGFAIVYTFAETADITRLPQDQAWGYTNTCSGVGLLLGPLLTGGIYDIRHSHDDVFYVTGCIFLFQLSLYCLLVYYVHKRDRGERLLFETSMISNTSAGGPFNDYTQIRGNEDEQDEQAAIGRYMSDGKQRPDVMAIVNSNNYAYDQKQQAPGEQTNYALNYDSGIDNKINGQTSPQQQTPSPNSVSFDENASGGGVAMTNRVTSGNISTSVANKRSRLQSGNSKKHHRHHGGDGVISPPNELATQAAAMPGMQQQIVSNGSNAGFPVSTNEAINLAVSPSSANRQPRMYTVNYQPNDSRLIYDQ